MRLVKRNPDAMPHCWPPPSDGTAWMEDGTKAGAGKAGVAILLAAVLAVVIALCAAGGGG